MDQGSDGHSTVERGRRRRLQDSAPPIWFGILFLAMGLLALVVGVAAATGNTPPGTTVSGPPLVMVGFGAFFALIGAALLWTSIRARRLEQSASTDPPGSAPAAPSFGALETIRFTRPPFRVLMDLLAPIGGIAFLGLAVFLLRTDGMDILIALMSAFFGVLLLAGAGITMRRGIRMRIAEVGPAGIWTPEMGRLAWSQVGELRVEDMRGVGPNNTGTAIYRRLGIVPRDPALAARAPGRMAMGMVRGFTGLMNGLRPGVGLSDPGRLAPFGINATEIEQPFEHVVAAVERYMPVTVVGVVPATPAIVPAFGASVLGGLPGVIEEVPTGPGGWPSSAPVDAAAAAGGAGASPDDHPAARTFQRRSSILPIGGLGMFGDLVSAATWVAFPALFLVIFPLTFFSSGGASLGPGAILFFAFLLIPFGFALYGVGQLLQVPARQRLRTGSRDLLTVDADGVDMRGIGRLRWSEIREVRAVDSGRPTGEDSPSIPRLEIVPRDPRRFGDRPRADRWYDAYRSFLRRIKPFGDRSPVEPAFRLDFDLLDASPDEVLDLIARYRVVDDQT